MHFSAFVPLLMFNQTSACCWLLVYPLNFFIDFHLLYSLILHLVHSAHKLFCEVKLILALAATPDILKSIVLDTYRICQ